MTYLEELKSSHAKAVADFNKAIAAYYSDPKESVKQQYDFEDGKGPVPAHKHCNGGGWVANTAHVRGTARVEGNAKVFGYAKVTGSAKVYGYAEVFGCAEVFGYAEVFGKAKVFGNAKVGGNSSVSGSATVSETETPSQYKEIVLDGITYTLKEKK